MKNYTSFADLDGQNSDTGKNEKPVWEVGFNDEKELLKWLNREFKDIEQNSDGRINDIKKNIALYKGVHYYSQEARVSRRDREEVTSKYRQKVVVNHLYEITERKVAKAVKFKPNVAVTPVQDESEDRHSAKVSKMVYDHIYEFESLDMKNAQAVKLCFVTGEAYAFIEWDPDKGPEIEETRKAREEGIELPVLDDEGNEVKDNLGKAMKIKDPIAQGDVSVKIVNPMYVFPERKRNWEDLTFIFRKEIKDLAEMKKRYPKKADEIKADKEASYFDFSKFEESKMQREVWVHHFYHKKTKMCPEGRHVIFTKDAILYNRPLDYSHGDFPCERLCEIEIPDELHGQSSFMHGRALQGHHNNLVSMQVRNQYMCAHPKIAVPQGSVKLESLGNDITIVQYKGGIPPQVLQFNPTSPQTIELAERMKEDMGVLMGVQGVSKGEPPPGVKAGVALQFLSEQEHERSNSFVASYNDFVRRCAAKIISVAGDKYKEDDRRILRVLGKNNEYLSEFLDPKHLTKSFDFRIQNSSSLPKSVPARTQTLIDLSERWPDMFTKEQIMDMLEMGNVNRFYDESTAAIKAAEQAYEMMVDGKEVPAPAEYQDHINWWKIFASRIQSIQFMKMPEETKQLILDHLEAREMLMVEKMEKNPVFAEQLNAIPSWPMLYEKPAPPPGMDMPPPMEGGPMGPGPEGEMPPPPQQGSEQLVQMQAQGQEVNPQLPPLQPGMPS